MFHKIFFAIQIIAASLLFVSCKDDLEIDPQIIGEGEALVEATLEFKPSITNLGSRTSGTAISNINTLQVVIYHADEDTTFFQLINVENFEQTSTSDTPSDYPTVGEDPNKKPNTTETSTAKVSFKTALPYGRYYMYAVANLRKGDDKSEYRTLTDDDVRDIKDLKSITCKWNPTDISKNDEMFGYFTNDVKSENSAFKPAPAVIVNKKNVNLHSWIKRLASKVTVAFNGSGLHQNIVVYVHNVSIRQIPLTCTLGEGNKPGKDQITSDRFHASVTDTTQVLYYNNLGITKSASKYDWAGDTYKKWLPVANGVGKEATGIVGSDHSNDAQALFFYENMQGVWPDKPKNQQRDKVGTNVGPSNNLPNDYTSEDYKDEVEYGTFIEVEAYYQCDTVPISNGPIRYRFMLGQNVSDNYDAIRNHHYKLTLGFKGYANQPDWHIEYVEDSPEIYAPEIYIPYTYNTSVKCPVRFNGKLTALRAEIIENNWAPYDSTEVEVPDAQIGSTNFDLRTLQFNWAKAVYSNDKAFFKDVTSTLLDFNRKISASDNSKENYIYGRHFTGYYHLNDDGSDNTSKPYYVTPIWAGFLRLQVPDVYQDSTKVPVLPAIIVYNRANLGVGAHYSATDALTDFRNYYYGKEVEDADENKDYLADNGAGNGYKTGTNLSARVFNISDPSADPTNTGRNVYTVEKSYDPRDKEKEYTTVTLNLWTQPKSMCGNSGFSGNNPYEDFNRRAVIRFTATFEVNGVEKTLREDVVLYQSKRLVNPKAVWRSHDKPSDFNVTVMERNVKGYRNEFQPLVSRGEWHARIKTVSPGAEGFISLNAIPGTGGISSNGEIVGKTLSAIKFTIDFKGPIGFNESKSAIIEVKYHGNTCVHNIFVRQGFHHPVQITENGPYWSSYNLFSCDSTTTYSTEDANVPSVLSANPLSFGAFFKRGNYARAISVANIYRTGSGEVNEAGFGPLQFPGITSDVYPNPDLNGYPGLNGKFLLTGRNSTFTWYNIGGNTTPSWHWTDNFKVKVKDDSGNLVERTYRVPTIAEFQALQSADFGVGVLYGDGANAPAEFTQYAYGFLDPNNDETESHDGMRGFICYNTTNANQVFFPIGTSGIGRRTVQSVANTNQEGTLRYGSTRDNLSLTGANSMRPIPMNMANAPGSIYWARTASVTTGDKSGMPIAWDMNYFDLNFTSVSANVVSITSNGAREELGGGDALPIKLVTDTQY